MTGDWWAGAVAAGVDGPPEPEEWTRVEVPGTPSSMAGESAVAYRTTFGDPLDGPHERAVLVLEGAHAATTVWCNGECLGTHDVPFVPAALEFDPEPTNELLVSCRAPTDRYGGIHDTDRVPDEDAVPGIRWNVRVERRPPDFIADVAVRPEAGGEDATIEVAVTVDAAEAVEDHVTLSVRPEGFRGGGTMERMAVDVPAGSVETLTRTVAVRDPRRWWPEGVGEQHRYTVRAKLGDRARSRTTGLRTVERGAEGLLVNGRPVPGHGVTRLPGGDPETDVRRALDANATVIRPLGHVPSPAFHRACDEAGLLVWQDLPLVGRSGFDPTRGRRLAEALSRGRGHHPSIACCTVQGRGGPPFEGSLGSGVLDRLRLGWRRFRDDPDPAPARSVADALPDHALALPVAGPPWTDVDALETYPGWTYGSASEQWVPDGDATLPVGGFGGGALAHRPEDRPSGFDWAAHEARVGGPDVAASQTHQARVCKLVAEALRRAECPLVVVDSLRDTRQVGGFGIRAADDTPKRAFDAVASSFEPLQVVLDGPPEAATGVVVCNDTPDRIEGSVRVAAGEETASGDVEASPWSRTPVPDLAVPSGGGPVQLALETPEGVTTNTYPR